MKSNLDKIRHRLNLVRLTPEEEARVHAGKVDKPRQINEKKLEELRRTRDDHIEQVNEIDRLLAELEGAKKV